MIINPLVLITGPSGSGKTTIVKSLETIGCWEAVSHTTREKRDGEIEGINYYFVSKEEFKALHEGGEFYEMVEAFDGNSYGISRRELDFKVRHQATLLIAEPSGVLQIEENYKLGPILKIWIDASLPIRVCRMSGRGDSEEKMNKRLKNDEEYFPAAKKTVKWDHEFVNDGNNPSDAAFHILTEYIHPVINQIQLAELKQAHASSYLSRYGIITGEGEK